MSNNITPIRQPPVTTQQDWWFPPQQGCPPPQVWPPQQPCPPQPCPTPPSCFSQVAQANACWDQSQALYNLVSKVVMDIFQTNPGIIPPPPPSQGSGPLLGVTDGSSAAPGIIGEFIEGSGTFAYPGSPNITSGSISTLVAQPGDWDFWAYATFGPGPIGGAEFYLQPSPPGMSNDLLGQAYTTGATGVYEAIIGPYARGSFTVPTLLAFFVNINNSLASSLTAGTMTLTVQGRRRR